MFDELQSVISKTEALGANYVEARYDELLLRSIIKENGQIVECKAMKRAGVGFNVSYQGATGYAFSADLATSAMEHAAASAFGIAKASAPVAVIKSEFEPFQKIDKVHLKPDIREPPQLVDTSERMDLINRMEASANEYGENISSLEVRYGELSGEKIFTNSEGTEIHWFPNQLELRCIVTSKTREGDLVDAADMRGGSFGLELFKKKENTPEDFGRNASLWAKEKMKAKSAPAGVFRALAENRLVGVLAHESFGHLTEADFVVSKGSPISDKLGQTLGSEHVTIIDEGVPSISGDFSYFWLPYDDQGVKTTRTVLIEKGVLQSFLHSRVTAKLLNGELTGNNRAVNFTFPPIPRMKNTYFTPGDLSEEEALELLGTGIYAIRTSGGQVEGTGDFLFKAVQGYWVEKGEKKYPLKDVTLTGNILQLLMNVEGATKDFDSYSSYYGGCGKGDQYPLPVGVGGPKLIINNVRFGGSA